LQAKGDRVKLSVIIISWNTCALLEQCLSSLTRELHSIRPPELDEHFSIEVFVVDNGSTDESVQLVGREFPWVKLLVNDANLGFVKANNQAIGRCEGDYVLLLNSDTVVWPNALQQLVGFLESYPELGVVGAELRNGDKSLQPSWSQFPSLLSELLGRNFRVRRPYGDSGAYLVDWVGGACMMVRRAAIEDVGLLDEHFFMYSEETDWCYRIRQAGWHIAYLPGACVTHFGGASSASAPIRTLIQLYKSKLLFFRKHYGWGKMYLLRLGIILRTFVQLLICWTQAGLKNSPTCERYQSLLSALWRGV